ncbi:MAG: alpha/beta fold hydrolase [Bacteroidia bacterium]|nr:alpha/beta fold hydrolase [Bacteroidia bacterium]
MQTLILTHGALGFKGDLENLKNALINEGFEVHTFSFSGHGKQDFENEFNIPQFSLELENFIAKNNIIQPSVIGYSMGGYVALNLVLKNNSVINKIITLGTKFNWSKETVEKETRMLVPETILEKVPVFAKNLQTKHGTTWTELLKRTANLMRDISIKNYLNSESLKTIQNKVLLGLGDKDQMVSIEETVNVYKALSNANMYMLPATKHPVESLNIAVFITMVKEFLKEG